MNIYTSDKLYGFKAESVNKIEEIGASLIDLRHEKSGARLLLLDRKDDNATFAIGFKTTPTDDTGVFHIMEHSVLCGSKKFPIKDPFTELLKGSVSTYLNALTSGDKTLYPVSSKNAKAFFGLVDVYLDAVFNPLALENPFIFMQEGHRYELEDGKLTVTGVVYNEMKGVYSTADDYADYLISRLVCPGGTYSYDAGGNPDFITDLTYEDFKSAHDKFYHPSNACLFLDGDVEIDKILPLIDSYLSAYDKRENNVEISNGASPVTEVTVNTYPIEKEEDTEDKTRIYLCYNSYEHSDKEKLAALSLVTEALADLNNAPLTKKILDSGLCESFNFYTTRSYSLNSLNVTFIGVKDGKEKELIKVFDDAVKDILTKGIPKDILSAALRRREFNTREADFGTYPLGMVYMRSVIEAALFNESPSEALKYEDTFRNLRQKLDTVYYEEVLEAVIRAPRSTLILHPDPEFTDKKESETAQRLSKILDGMTEEEKLNLAQTNERFRLWQSEPNTPEELATLPTLSIEDLKTEPREIPTEINIEEGCEVILHPIHTGGISYAELYFDASDATEDELHYIRLFTDLVFEWSTEKSDVTEFRSKTKTHLGAFYLTPHPTTYNDNPKLYLLLHASCLDSEKENALDIIEEYLYSTRFEGKDVLKKNLKQLYTYSLEGIASRGDMYANIRSAARHSAYDAIIEHMFGYEYHCFIKDLLSNIDEMADDTLCRFEKIRNTYFRRERLTLGMTESNGSDFAKRIVKIVRYGGNTCGLSPISPMPKLNEGIAVPTSVSFASLGGNLNEAGENLYTGAFSLISSIASLEVLWNEIRLKNGAYDTGFFAKATGSVGAYSYRDPSPMHSLDYFRRVCDEMSAFLDTDPDLLKYIIGVFGSSDTVTTPRNDGSTATKRHLSAKTHESIVKRRKECLEATVPELKRITALIKDALSKSTFTVVGPRDELEKIDGIDKILDI